MGDAGGAEVSGWPVDARGLPCPIPIALLARALKEHPVVELTADDPAVKGDLEAYCAQTGARLLAVRVEGLLLRATVQRPTVQVS